MSVHSCIPTNYNFNPPQKIQRNYLDEEPIDAGRTT